MADLTVAASGKASAKFENEDVTLSAGANSPFSNGATAVVIHAKGDDTKTDPSGLGGPDCLGGAVTNWQRGPDAHARAADAAVRADSRFLAQNELGEGLAEFTCGV